MTDYASQLYSMISGVGDAYLDGRKQKLRQDQFAQQKAADDRNYARTLERDAVGDQHWGTQFGADQDYRGQTLGLQRANLDLAREKEGRYAETLDRVAGYSRNPDGSMSYIPGGPADPRAVAALAEARNDGKPPRPLPNATLNDLGGKGAAVDDLHRLNGEFKDNYGGATAGWIGDVQNTIGRNVGAGYGDQANWWQDYQSRKNVVRNNLFGSALTAQEKAEFDKADINPGMTPDAIRTNLSRQQMIATRAARKLASAYVLQGYSPDVIEGAIGIPLSDLGADSPDAGGGNGDPAPRPELRSLPSGGMPVAPATQGAVDRRNGAAGGGAPSRADIEAEMRRRGLGR